MISKFLMRQYPKTARKEITETRVAVLPADREKAQRFDETYFDTERRFGYGGYHYHPHFFTGVVKDFIYYYDLKPGMRVLDVGCAKGFMLHDFKKAMPGLAVAGVDISDYALSKALPDVAQYLQKACCSKLPFADKSFDLVISISTIHNLDLAGVRQSLKEIIRVSRGAAFIKVNGYKNLHEREQLENWNLVAKTILRESEWEELFDETGYAGDYDFFKT
jgi:SAM-dependent methyltransferase